MQRGRAEEKTDAVILKNIREKKLISNYVQRQIWLQINPILYYMNTFSHRISFKFYRGNNRVENMNHTQHPKRL